ncbi:hypothetical protein FM115_06180 [Marinilactibacillus psychrotolerans 42ea]|uniref:Uncharacterized protein n=1 Tax=Marinilactibacillus psychrotolerans 42ea TaxID=1255609 RepID=A0A1R4JP64_9LACT|nr:hypothetical protein FM115_06180 [Marinilactibacillus psychrotolerans 42ea]
MINSENILLDSFKSPFSLSLIALFIFHYPLPLPPFGW